MADAQTSLDAGRWAVLALLGVAQLMVVLAVTIVNIALPSGYARSAVSDAIRYQS
jgi:hypothetical protein